MKAPDREGWKVLQRWVSTPRTCAPTAVMLAVASLVRQPQAIVAGHTSAELSETSVWTAHVVTDESLTKVSMSFGADYYDLEEESAPQYRNNAPETRVLEAWVRPRGSVVSVDVDRVFGPMGRPQDWYSLSAVTLNFADGEKVALPGQDGLHDQAQRDDSDAFHVAIREAIGY